jgi:hypothetical protein
MRNIASEEKFETLAVEFRTHFNDMIFTLAAIGKELRVNGLADNTEESLMWTRFTVWTLDGELSLYEMLLDNGIVVQNIDELLEKKSEAGRAIAMMTGNPSLMARYLFRLQVIVERSREIQEKYLKQFSPPSESS